MANTLIKLSQNLRHDADALLKESGVLEFLSRYGRVAIHGSYDLDLMVDGDIDIDVVQPRMTKQISLKALNQLIKKDYFRGYLYYDFTSHFYPGFPPYYYVGLKTRFRGRKWKIDIWLMPTRTGRYESLAKYIKKNLTPEIRGLILKLKHQAKTRGLEISGYRVYMAVLKKGVKNLAELQKVINKI